MKKVLCLIISLAFLLSTFSVVWADNGHGNGNKKGWSYQDELKELKNLFKLYQGNLEQESLLLKNLGALKKQFKDHSINIFIDGEEVVLDAQPFFKDKSSRMMVPIAPIVKGLGATISWNPKEQTLTIVKGDTTIVLKIGSNVAIVNGHQVKIDDKVFLKGGRMFVPISFISKVLKNKLDFDEDSGIVIIDKENKTIVNDNVKGTGLNQFEYSSGWNYVSQQGAYLGDYHWSNNEGSYARFRFSGVNIKLYGAKAPNHGIASISIDGKEPVEVDLYSKTRRDNTLLFSSEDLQDGEHTLKISVTGDKNDKSTDEYVTIDCAEVKGGGITANLALNKEGNSSSVYSDDYETQFAFDGNSSTRWSSRDTDPQWISVDLGSKVKLSRVKLYWEAAYAKSYRIDVSENNSSWTTVYSTTAGDGGLDDISFQTVEARYVRMYGRARANTSDGWGYSLYEFEVYKSGSGTTPAPVTNRYEAESAVLSGDADTENDYDHYSGTGYVTNFEDTGARVLFDINVPKAGTYKVQLRYSNGNTGSRTISMYINNQDIKQLSLAKTSNWDTWADLTEYVSLNAGDNTIAFRKDSGDTGEVNIDYILVDATTELLTGSMSNSPASVNLSNEGTVDWVHWGFGGVDGFDRKNVSSHKISDFSVIGSADPVFVSSSVNPVKYSWTGGTPNAEVSNTASSVYLSGKNNGFTFTVPADTTQRTLKIYTGAWDAKVKLEANLEDSGLVYQQEYESQDGVACKVFTINYRTAGGSEDLVIKFTVTGVYSSNFGNITLQSAALK